MPTFTVLDQPDKRVTDAELGGDIALKFRTAQSADFKHIAFRQLGVTVSSAAIARSMQQLICLVFGPRFPKQMPLCNTPKVAVSAQVSRVVARWRIAVLMLANQSMNQLRSPVHAKFGVACRAARVGPDKAVTTAIGQYDISEVFCRLTPKGRATGWASVFHGAAVVRLAKALSGEGLAAVGNRAYSGGSHRSLYTGFAGQNPLSVGALFGFAICSVRCLAPQGFWHA